jgi:uncharacterized protein YccT (UPF0319 family)
MNKMKKLILILAILLLASKVYALTIKYYASGVNFLLLEGISTDKLLLEDTGGFLLE